MTQGEVSRFERRSDVRVGTLQRFVRALGGSLEFVARFPKERAEFILLVPPVTPKKRKAR